MTWKPSIDEMVEVIYADHFYPAIVVDVENPDTKNERFILTKDWGLSQFNRLAYRMEELHFTGLRNRSRNKDELKLKGPQTQRPPLLQRQCCSPVL